MESYSLDDLRLFLGVARQRSFIRAARELAIPASTLSRRVGALEAALGVALLVRSSRHVALTREGERLVEQTAGLLDALRAAADAALDARLVASGVVRVTAPLATGAEWATPIVARLCRRHPQLTVHLQLTNEVVDLPAGRVDVALRAGPLASSGLVARRLREVRYALYAAPAFVDDQLRGRPRIEAAELAALPAILVREAGRWRLRGPDGRRHTLAPRARLVVNDPRAALVAACEGLGVACVPEELAARHGRALLPVTCAGLTPEPRSLYVVTRPRASLPLRVRVVVDALIEGARHAP